MGPVSEMYIYWTVAAKTYLRMYRANRDTFKSGQSARYRMRAIKNRIQFMYAMEQRRTFNRTK